MQGEADAEEYEAPGTDFLGLATAWFAHKMAKVGICSAPRCCGCLVTEVVLPHCAGDFPPVRGSGILYGLRSN